MKGRIDRDVAEEAARQAWGARELLLRLRFPTEQIALTCGVPLGGEQRQEIKDRTLESAVTLRMMVKEGEGLRSYKFTITCGPVASASLFAEAVRRRMSAIAAGVFSEADLLRAYNASSAFGGRHEVVAALKAKGFPIPSDWERQVAPELEVILDPSREVLDDGSGAAN